MKVLIVVHTFPTISGTFVVQHCATLLDRGHEVSILAVREDIELLRLIDSRGVSLPKNRIVLPKGSRNRLKRWIRQAQRVPKRLMTLRLFSLAILDRLRQYTIGNGFRSLDYLTANCNFNDYDVIHVHFGNNASPIAQLRDAGVLQTPIVVTFHGTDLNRDIGKPNKEVYERVFRTSAALTVGTAHMVEHLEAAGIPSDKYHVIPMGINLDDFPFTERRAIERPILASVGRLIECKGTEYLIRAVERLHYNWPRVVVHIIGDGPLRDSLESLATELGVESHVQFHGAVPHDATIALLQDADIYVHPGIVAKDGTREGQGLAIAEAQALGLPVVASRVGGIPEIVAEGESALLTEPGDVNGIAAAIEQLINDPTRAAAMGRAGRQFVETHLDQQQLVNRWISVYEQAIESPQATST